MGQTINPQRATLEIFMLGAFDNNLEIKDDFRKHLKETYGYVNYNQHLSFKFLPIYTSS